MAETRKTTSGVAMHLPPSFRRLLAGSRRIINRQSIGDELSTCADKIFNLSVYRRAVLCYWLWTFGPSGAGLMQGRLRAFISYRRDDHFMRQPDIPPDAQFMAKLKAALLQTGFADVFVDTATIQGVIGT